MKNLLNIQDWNEREVRIELSGNGHYVLKENLTKFIKDKALEISLEIQKNIG